MLPKISFEPDVEKGSEFPPNGSFGFVFVTGTEEVGSLPKKPKSLSFDADYEPTPLNISVFPLGATPGPAGRVGNLYFSI
jgi:hypothetical protein